MICTEDKRAYTIQGAKDELIFVGRFGYLGFSMNPAKSYNPYAVDMLYKGELADLKTQKAPLFTAGKFDYDPQYTVTFNLKDFDNYFKNYLNLKVVFHAHWQTTSMFNITVQPMEGVWITDMINIALRRDKIITYKNRVNDPINAKESYLLDLRHMRRLI